MLGSDQDRIILLTSQLNALHKQLDSVQERQCRLLTHDELVELAARYYHGSDDYDEAIQRKFAEVHDLKNRDSDLAALLLSRNPPIKG